LGAILYLYSSHINGDYEDLTFVSRGTFVEYNLGQRPSFHSSSENIFFTNVDGLFMYNTDGELLWSHPHHRSEPVLMGNGNFVAWGSTPASAPPEGGGNFAAIHVANQYGILYTITSHLPPLTFSINKLGQTAVIYEDGFSYRINVYNQLGMLVLETVFEDANVFPVNATLSPDGSVFVVSVMNINNANITSNIMFFCVDGSIMPHGEPFFGATSTQEGIIGMLNFMDDNILIVTSSHQVKAVDTRTLNVLWQKNVMANHIAFPTSDTVAIVTDIIHFYDLSGELIGHFDPDSQVNYISTGSDHLIVGTGALNRKFYGVNTHGEIIWEHVALHETTELLFLDGPDQLLLVTPINAQILNHKEEEDRR